LGCELNLDGEPEFNPPPKKNIFQRIYGTTRKHLKKTCADTQMKFYEVIARPTLPYGSETWIITTRDMTCLEAAEMRFLRNVKGNTRLDKIRSQVIRQELEISGIQDVRSKHKQRPQTSRTFYKMLHLCIYSHLIIFLQYLHIKACTIQSNVYTLLACIL
jgi:hypothetical protein